MQGENGFDAVLKTNHQYLSLFLYFKFKEEEEATPPPTESLNPKFKGRKPLRT